LPYIPCKHQLNGPQIIGFGQILCFDSFLYTFTILPIRFILALFPFFSNLLRPSAPPLPASQKADLLRALLLVLSLLLLSPLTDASKIYHTIRGQDTIKLYVIFNALEVRFCRLCKIPTDKRLDWGSLMRIHRSRYTRLPVFTIYFGAAFSQSSNFNAKVPSGFLFPPCVGI